MNRQTTDQLMMVRPANFGFNPETAASNAFQQLDESIPSTQVSQLALAEFEKVLSRLRELGVSVLIVEDTADPVKTDAVFPNNWISTHEPGQIVTYPMCSENRRLEVRADIVHALCDRFVARPSERLSLEHHVSQSRFLEGTGSLVLDRLKRVAFACRSPRTDEWVLGEFCEAMRYRSVVFDACDGQGTPIYHTNVMMSVTESLAVVCWAAIDSQPQRELVREELQATDRQVVEISLVQMEDFAGNMLQVCSSDGRRLLLMSSRARRSLSANQLAVLESESEIVDFEIPVIEKYGGGSIRCMLAEIFLEPRVLRS